MTNAKVISISPKIAWQNLQNDSKTILIDVRSGIEFLFIGHPQDAKNISWIDDSTWDINPDFTDQIYTLIQNTYQENDEQIKATPILLICRCGNRSLEAGKVLIKNNFTQVYNIIDGFEGQLDSDYHRGTLGGWRFDNLPWQQC
ncbi:MAG: rhodanese-like domain-containing protein [Thiomargarita sp.]|nr:rhodanese-like domain-containing protein [Thiomargarita sp.]